MLIFQSMGKGSSLIPLRPSLQTVPLYLAGFELPLRPVSALDRTLGLAPLRGLEALVGCYLLFSQATAQLTE